MRSLGIYNVNYRHDDGWNGWEKYGPYDGIIVAAAAPEVPEKLLHQLEIGGTLIMPFGEKEKQEGIMAKPKKKSKSTVNKAGNYTKPSMRKALFNRIKAGGKGGAPGQWSARKAQMLAKQYKAKGGGYK